MNSLSFNLRRLWWAVGSWLCLLGGMAAPDVRAQALSLKGLILTNGAVVVSHASDTNRYYLLLRGDRIEQTFLPQDAALGLAGVGVLRDRTTLASQAFYRILSVPLVQPLDSDRDGIDDVYELQTPGLNPLDNADAGRSDPRSPGQTYLSAYRLAKTQPARVVRTSPFNGESGVAVTRETIFDFDQPLAVGTVLSTTNLFATFAGRRILSRVELSSDRRKATLFYLENLPASARIRATLDGTGLQDASGKLFDPDADGVPGGMRVVDFDTLSITPVGTTAVVGRVLASDKLPNGQDQPLKGVIVTVDGAEESLRTKTDENGFFRLQPAPSGRFFVHVDGRLAVGSSWPNGAYYPVVGKAWEAVAGVATNPANSSGIIYLPLIPSGALQSVSTTNDTKITFPPSVVAANPALAGVEITVPANSLFDDNGQRGGRVGIAPVSADRLPEPLPAGIEHVLDITVQSDGPRNFDRPVPVRFPNLASPTTGKKVPAGEKTALVSFNHDVGRWEVVGTMTASADGRFLDSDPGVGVRQPGWHGWQRLTWPTPNPPIYWPPNWNYPPFGPFPPPFPQPSSPPQPTPNPNSGPGPGPGPSPTSPGPGPWPEISSDPFPAPSDDGAGSSGWPDGGLTGGNDDADPANGNGPGGGGGGGQNSSGQAAGVAAGFFCLTANIESDCTNSGPAVAAAATVAIDPADGSLYTLRYSDFNGTVTAEVHSRASGQSVFQTQVNPIRPPNSVGFGPGQQAFVSQYRQATPNGLGGDEVVLLATLNAGNAQALAKVITVPASLYNASSVSFSPHGRYLVYTGLRIDGNVTLVVVDVATRETVLNLSVPYSAAPLLVQPQNMVEFSPDCSDRTLVLHLGDTPTSLAWYVYNLATKKLVVQRRAAPGNFSSWVFSPCGDAVSLAAGPAVAREYWATLNGRALNGLNAHANSDVQELLTRSSGRSGRAGLVAEIGTPPEPSALPAVHARFSRGLHYWVLEDLLSGQVVKRGRTGGSGVLLEGELLAPNRPFRLSVVRAADLYVGRVDFVSGNVGASFRPPAPILTADASTDQDGDGLTDFAELVVGSNPRLIDSNGDGMNDGAAVRAGLDPNAGGALATGLVAAAPLGASAVDVCAEGDRLAVALGASGVALVQHPPGQNPTVIARVDTPGDARRVACFGTFLAVADGPAGLQIIDVSDPPAARIAFYLPSVGNANCVVTADGVAYVGTEAGQVVMVNLASGTELSRTSLNSPVQDLKFGGDRLYILSNRRILPFRVESGELVASGPAVTSGSGESATRLFVGGGFAYITHLSGYRVFDLVDPDHPVEKTTGNDTQRGWLQLVANGSGLGLAAAGTAPGNAELQVYNLSDPTQNTTFVTRYSLPTSAAANAVTIHRGIGYVATTTAGLQVVNYLAADTGTNPPAISLAASFPLHPAQLETGRFASLTALATDDVQVREVEFYLNGTRVATDGSFPFEYAFYAPPLTSSRTSFKLRARAIDTAGNATWSEEITVSLLPDSTPPRARPTAPSVNGYAVSPDRIGVLFNEPIAADSLLPNRLSLTYLGKDRRQGTADDVVVEGEVIYNAAARIAELHFPAVLNGGRYLAKLTGGVRDLAGNVNHEDLVWGFEVVIGIDSDGDGLTDEYETKYGLDPKNADQNNNGIPDSLDDFDGDGLTNGQEMLLGTDPRNQRTFNGVLDTQLDSDGDYLTDIQELLYGTDPHNPDTDGDGWNDEIEVHSGSDPLTPNRYLPGLFGGLQHADALLHQGVLPATSQAYAMRFDDGSPTVSPQASVLREGGPNENGASVNVAVPIVRLRIFDPQADDLSPYELPRTGAFVIEAEDYNYNSGQHVPLADVMPYLGGSYSNLVGVLDVDYHDLDGADSQVYRPLPAGKNVNLLGNLFGQYGLQRPSWNVTKNYRVGWEASGDWLHYTRAIPTGNYFVWAALSYNGTSPNQLSASLDRVTGDTTQPNATATSLGSFLAPGSGAFGNNDLVLLRDALGNPAVVTVTDPTTTLRFNLGSGDFDWFVLIRTDALP